MQLGDKVRSIDTGDVGVVRAVLHAINGVPIIRAHFALYSIEGLATSFEPYRETAKTLADFWTGNTELS